MLWSVRNEKKMTNLPFILLFCGLSQALNLNGCDVPVGLETGEIADEDLLASSSFDYESVGPNSARIRNDISGGAWCPKQQIDKETYEYLEVNMKTLRIVTAVETQGRYGGGQGREYPTQYLIDYWRPETKDWIRYKNRRGDQLLTGNTDTSTSVFRSLDPPVIASRIRFVPFSIYPRTMCMRVEVYGCKNQEGVIWYQINEGVYKSGKYNFKDRTYDGWVDVEDGLLSGGLGQLTDGQTAILQPVINDVRDDEVHESLKPDYPWVAWNKDKDDTINLLFVFDHVRNFSLVRFHSTNHLLKSITVFKRARIWFSIDGKRYHKSPISNHYGSKNIIETPHWVPIAIPNRVGRFVKIELELSKKWLMLSEVEFESKIVTKNLTDVMFISNPTDQLNPNKETAEDGENGMRIAPMGDLPGQYLALIIGVIISCIIIFGLIIVIILIRQKRNRKLFSNSPAYSGLKMLPPGASANLTLKQNMGLGIFPSIENDNVPSVSTLPRAPPTIFNQGKLTQAPNGTLYVTSERGQGSSLGRGPSPLDTPRLSQFSFPPPPPPDFTDQDSSEYAEPTELNKSTATLPLLIPGSPRIRPVPPPRGMTSQRSPGHRYKRSPKHNCAVQTRRNVDGDQSPSSFEGSLHYASTDVRNQGDTDIAIDVDTGYSSPSGSGCSSIVEVCSDRLRFVSPIGQGEFGPVHLCQVDGLNTALIQDHNDLHTNTRLVAVKLLSKDASQEARCDFDRELQVLCRLHDANIVQLLGACTQNEPVCMIQEYLPNGDLRSYLQTHKHNLSVGICIYMGTQVASGMKYLESLNFVHRDLAARNCVVGQNHSIKIGDFGMAMKQYSNHYYPIDGNYMLPIRWMAWEAVVMGKFSPKSDVWSFSILLWEIFTFGERLPLEDLNDEQVVENAHRISCQDPKSRYLSCPLNCSKEISDLMIECWQRQQNHRPSFIEIHLFLQRKNLGFDPTKEYS